MSLQVVTAMTSSSPDSVVEADVLAGELFECEDEEEEEEEGEEEEEDGDQEGEWEEQEEEEEEEEEVEGARIKRQEPTPAGDACATIGVADPLGSFSRDSHPEGSSCYWYAGKSYFYIISYHMIWHLR